MAIRKAWEVKYNSLILEVATCVFLRAKIYQSLYKLLQARVVARLSLENDVLVSFVARVEGWDVRAFS